MALAFNDSQKQVYFRYINLVKYNSILEKESKKLSFYNKLCGNSTSEIKAYLISLGILDNTIIDSLIYSASVCDLTQFNVGSEETSDLNNGNVFINFLHNFFISYYAPYYDLFNKLSLIILTIRQMYHNSTLLKGEKIPINWSKINKTIFANKLNIIDELIKSLQPNTNLITYFDLTKLRETLSNINITCNANECIITNINSINQSKIYDLINNKIAINMPLVSLNFLIKDYNIYYTNILTAEQELKKEVKQEVTQEITNNDKDSTTFMIISAVVVLIIIIVSIIIFVSRQNTVYNSMGMRMGMGMY
jgi:hypothetical protein